MAPASGSATYKKKDGTIAVSRDGLSVSWTPVAPSGSKPAVTVAVSNITNLQQTPPTNPKVMLKVFEQGPGTSEAVTHVFNFTSPSQARAEAEAIKNILSTAIAKAKAGTVPAAARGSPSSGAMAIASAVNTNGTDGLGGWDNDARLLSDRAIRQSLLSTNPSLSKTFLAALQAKPASISNTQFETQFWSSRLHMLRAHAIERGQSKGAYNVLSTIKPRTEDGKLKLNVTKEQIQLIFSQHGLVKRVYDENVPRMYEAAFWADFFQSRLFKKLKGERISDSDPQHPLLDKYLSQSDDAEREKHVSTSHIPHIIDVEGNEQNHSQRKGNAPDLTMRPTATDRVPIIRTLNSISEKIMSHVAPNDVDPSEPIGMDEATFNELALRDLAGDAEENRVILNIKDQSRFFSSGKEYDISRDNQLYAKQDPSRVLQKLLLDLSGSVNEDLSKAIGYNEETSDSDPEDEGLKSGHIGSRTDLRKATAQILDAIAQQRAQNDDLSTSAFSTVQSVSTCDIPSSIFDEMTLTHATTNEFLHHFWQTFLSGDPNRAEEIASLVETLDRSMDRIKKVADKAETEALEQDKQWRREYYLRTKVKIPFKAENVKGGAKAVNQLMAPTVRAIGVATSKYKEAMIEAET